MQRTRNAAAMATVQDPSQQSTPEREDARTGVQSIVRAFAILEVIATSPDGIALSDISKKVGLHNSTAFNLVKTMLALGYIRQQSADKRYAIGRSFFCLAANSQDDAALASIAAGILGELSSATGETSHFAVWAGNQVAVIAKADGAGAFKLSDNVLGNRPAYATALGKVLLSSLSAPELARYFENVPRHRLTARTITDEQLLTEEIASICKEHLAYDDGEFHEEIRCVAVPVFGFTDHVVGALGVSGPIWRQSLQAMKRQAQLLNEAAAKLSAELGRGGIDAHYSPARRAITRAKPAAKPLHPASG